MASVQRMQRLSPVTGWVVSLQWLGHAMQSALCVMCALAPDVATWLATAGRIVVLPLRMPVRTLEQRSLPI
ncbi:hypothetical protein XvhCFBP2543_10625 [Xanthomonas vasicola]|uniref:Secreted protein n=1 Tax=Xanthomonas vasicola TaxID=56459 RepID=A0ABD7SAK8_XANVA|nr:hypothetical protein NX81_002645 [Xanthomonas vasicola]KGR41622.1 hypothetical protein NX04_13585 [Xanthomonas vasicola]KGR43937.1 hypothetical protein NX05_10850 [Xanthomonas vasicola]KGR60527.1 hypothetical protein NX79_10260 [Xanthomonas vasicola]PPV02691.1 hypothetical protein XvhCFBP2543_10625 [Xanthomonas vasicola]